MNVVLTELGIELLAGKAIFLQESRTLVVADLHFGKVNHFRRAGLPVPPAAGERNIEMLVDLIQSCSPLRMIFLGDLFHSHYNEEWEAVGQILAHFPGCRFQLVKGNHDIMGAQQYSRKGLEVIDQVSMGRWMLTHEPMDIAKIPEGKINMAGHLHPGARLFGRGLQSVMLPCFWFSEKQVILPAFGSLTGLMAIQPGADDRVYIILEKKVVRASMESSGKRRTALR